MLGDDKLFEKLVQAGEEVENDSNKNVDEDRAEINRRGEMDSFAIDLFRTTKLNLPEIQQKLQDEFGIDAEESEAIVDAAYLIVKDVDEKEVKEAQAPFTKQEIQFAIGELQDKLAGGEHASPDDLDRWDTELERLEKELVDAPDEEEFESSEKTRDDASEPEGVDVRGELPHYDYDTDNEELDRISTIADELYVGASHEDKVYLQSVMDEIMYISKQHERDAELEAAEENKVDTVSNDPAFERTVEKFFTQLGEAQLKEGEFSCR